MLLLVAVLVVVLLSPTEIACGPCVLASLGVHVDSLVEVQRLQKVSSLPHISDLSLQWVRYVPAPIVSGNSYSATSIIRTLQLCPITSIIRTFFVWSQLVQIIMIGLYLLRSPQSRCVSPCDLQGRLLYRRSGNFIVKKILWLC